MNCIFKYISIAVAAVCTIVGCKESYVTYSDAEYVMFENKLAMKQDPAYEERLKKGLK